MKQNINNRALLYSISSVYPNVIVERHRHVTTRSSHSLSQAVICPVSPIHVKQNAFFKVRN